LAAGQQFNFIKDVWSWRSGRWPGLPGVGAEQMSFTVFLSFFSHALEQRKNEWPSAPFLGLSLATLFNYLFCSTGA
jgi:hypothetical protein